MPDFKLIFEKLPGSYLILDAKSKDFLIVGVTDEYNADTLTSRDAIVGKPLFEVFPANPDDPASKGVENLTKSLEKVILSKKLHVMELQKYDIRDASGKFIARYWSPINIPVVDSTGDVAYIIHSVSDVTDLVNLKAEAKKNLDLLAVAMRLNDVYYKKLRDL